MKPQAYLNAFQVLSPAGRGLDALSAALHGGPCPGFGPGPEFAAGGASHPVGRIPFEVRGPERIAREHASRNNRLAYDAVAGLLPDLERLKSRYGASRIAVVVGTSTSGILEAEPAFEALARTGTLAPEYRYEQQEIGSPAVFLSAQLGLGGPALVVSTACSSSARALATARRLLRLDACDAVLCGGVDTLCRFTLHGFGALGALSDARCNPFSRNRKGIHIGEAAAFCLVSADEGPVRLAGCGEASDAYNVSAPLPGGEGAEAAMRAALADAGPGEIGYLNLHGTATAQNDAMEALATARVFPGGLPCSSTKPVTGHTLGAAGALEAAICWDLLCGRASTAGLPANLSDGQDDPALPAIGLLKAPLKVGGLKRAMSNSFGFGGSNVSLVLERV